MKKILFPLLMILVVVGGAVAADFVKNGGGEKDAKQSAHGDKKPDKHAKKDAHGDKKDKGHKKSKKKDSHDKKKDSHGKKSEYGDGGGADEISYLKFKRQFVVPVMQDGTIQALVIMNFNLVLDDHAPDNVFSYEPKLRDALTRELLGLSNAGIFGENLTSAASYETMREKLLTASRAVVKEGISDILILDVARQEQ